MISSPSRLLFVGAASLLFASSASNIASADSTTTIGLSASVADACSFGDVTDISFASEYEPGQSGTLEGNGSFVVNCTVDDQSITLTPDGGDNGGGSLGRRLVHETDTGELLEYSLFVSDTDGATTDVEFAASVDYSPITDLADGDNTFLLKAFIGQQQSAIGGDYGDNVDIVMSF